MEVSSDSGSEYSDSETDSDDLDEEEKLWRQQEREAEANDDMEREDKASHSMRPLWCVRLYCAQVPVRVGISRSQLCGVSGLFLCVCRVCVCDDLHGSM
jgi:hypothetical protein